MELGVGLPAVVPGTSADLILRWARDADAANFSTLGVHDRLAWDGFECLGVLNAAAAVTERIRLASLVLIAPLRPATLIASQAAAIQRLAQGRLTLGVGIGPRRDDYEAAGAAFGTRGRRLEDQLHELHQLWDAGLTRPRLLVGGGGDAALARMARHSDGYVHGGGPARAFKSAADRALTAWYDAGRTGQPRLVGTGYFALGGAEAEGKEFLRRYYRFVGPFAERIADGILTGKAEIEELAAGYAEAGCDELVLFPTVPRLDQLERLAEVAKGPASLGSR
ncbi:MAG: LLM class flavin-dependent oxidoreductase [Candidatus Dormibacteraeota bacterium]|nr:LLM class flavin-dependent oxidoreductase [Candidatus Dormibacteraeota bacterium]MDQ6918601.1 LLM class flavin-dependent oxidoreductase [Candidatus Dormibacteraeota bacterium]